MQDRSVTFYIPGLISPFKSVSGLEKELALDELALLFSRADKTSNAVTSFDDGLFSLFGFSGLSAALPVAPITRLIDCGEPDNGYWLRADPVHLQPNRDQVVMMGNAQLNVHGDEVRQIQNEFNALFGEDGLRLETPVNQRWYLGCQKSPQICTTPLEETLGKNIHDYLPKGRESLYWHKLLNEVQMLFYNSEVNERRRQEGRPEINSLWLWGGGCLPEVESCCWQTVWANDVLSRGLASLYRVEQASLPESLDDWAENAASGDHLIVFDGAHAALGLRDLSVWQSFMKGLESDWIAPAINALKRGDVGKIVIVTDGNKFTLTSKGLRRWWKKRRSLGSHG